MEKSILFIDSTGEFLNLKKMVKAVWSTSPSSITITLDTTDTFTYTNEDADYIYSVLISESHRIIEA